MKKLVIGAGGTLAACVLLAMCGDAETGRSEADGSVTRDSTPTAAVTPTAELREALEDLVRGPAEGDAGETSSWFSAETADVIRSVAVDSAGHAVVDFRDLRPLIPNASSSAGSAALLNELNATVFQFTGIRSVEYRMDGSCDRFWEWLQYGCQTVTRESAEDWR